MRAPVKPKKKKQTRDSDHSSPAGRTVGIVGCAVGCLRRSLSDRRELFVSGCRFVLLRRPDNSAVQIRDHHPLSDARTL